MIRGGDVSGRCCWFMDAHWSWLLQVVATCRWCLDSSCRHRLSVLLEIPHHSFSACQIHSWQHLYIWSSKTVSSLPVRVRYDCCVIRLLSISLDFLAQTHIRIVTWWLSHHFELISDLIRNIHHIKIPLVWYRELCMFFYRHCSFLLCLFSHILILNVSQTELIPHCQRIYGCICFSDPVLRGTVVSEASDVRPLNPGALFPINLFWFECWDFIYRLLWQWWHFLPLCLG